MTREAARTDVATIASIAIACAVLYFAREFLIPLALAALLAFMLTPVVRKLEGWGVARPLGVMLVAAAILSAAVLAAWFVTNEVSQLTASLPDFKATFAEKLRALRGPLRSLADALGWIDQMGKEIDPAAGHGAPAKVEVVQPTGVSTVTRYLSPLLGVLGTAGVVAILLIFMLVQSDLPKRLVTWLALRDSRLSPRAVDEAGQLVSRFLGRQALVCLIQGVVVSTALALIGVPGALVFGFISAILRSIPYFGPATAAALPIAFSAAAFHGFSMTLWTAGFFLCWELFTNNVLDPTVLGRGAGLTPFGVVLSATFWAWLWGGPGLFLAIPMTACLSVVGRYVPQLAFLPALLSHDSIASPAEQLYERLAARDDDEAATLLRHAAQDGDLVQISDAVVLPLLVQMARTRENGRISRTEMIRCLRRLRELLAEQVAAIPVTPHPVARRVRVEELRASALDRFARDWIATVLERVGFEVQDDARKTERSEETPTLVLTSVSDRALRDAASAARTVQRTRGRDALLLAAAASERGVTHHDVPVLPSCAGLVAALTPAPIGRSQNASETLEVLEPSAHVAR